MNVNFIFFSILVFNFLKMQFRPLIRLPYFRTCSYKKGSMTFFFSKAIYLHSHLFVFFNVILWLQNGHEVQQDGGSQFAEDQTDWGSRRVPPSSWETF